MDSTRGVWFQARSTIDFMSWLVMFVNPERARDLNDMTNELARWDATVGDYEVKFGQYDIPGMATQAANVCHEPRSRAEDTYVHVAARLST